MIFKDTKIKLLMPIGSFYPSRSGGPNNSIYWLAQELSKYDFKSIIVTSTSGIDDDQNIRANKWIKTEYGDIIYNKAFFHYLPLRAFFIAIRKMSKVDILYVSNLFYPLSWLCTFVNVIFYRKPVIWSVRGELEPEALQFSRFKKKPILWLIKNFLSKNCTFHTTSSSETKNTLAAFGHDIKIIQIPNLIKLPKKIERRSLEKYLLYVGRVHPIKSLDKLIKALALSEKFMLSSFKFYIAGNNNNAYGESIEKLVQKLSLEKKVVFLGHVDNIQKEKLFANAYFTFLVSQSENFGNVVLESLSQGTPVVASKGTPWEILKESNAGFWIDNAVDAITEVVDKILSMSDSDNKKYRENAFLLLKKNFDISTKIHLWVELIHKVITK